MNKFTAQEITWWPVYYAREMLEDSIATLVSGLAIVGFLAIGSLPYITPTLLIIGAISGYLLGTLLLWLIDKLKRESADVLVFILSICWGAVIGCPLGIFVHALRYG